MKRRKFLVAYGIGVHAMLAAFIARSNFAHNAERKFGFIKHDGEELGFSYKMIVAAHKRMDGSVPKGAAIFIGDSLIQSLFVQSIASPAANFGIGGDTTAGVLQRIPIYGSIQRAGMVVLSVGINDFEWRSVEELVANYEKILGLLPRGIPVLVNGILPVDKVKLTDPRFSNATITEANAGIHYHTMGRPKAKFIDVGWQLKDETGGLSNKLHIGDGVHLNTKGNNVWIQCMKNAISNGFWDGN